MQPQQLKGSDACTPGEQLIRQASGDQGEAARRYMHQLGGPVQEGCNPGRCQEAVVHCNMCEVLRPGQQELAVQACEGNRRPGEAKVEVDLGAQAQLAASAGRLLTVDTCRAMGCWG